MCAFEGTLSKLIYGNLKDFQFFGSFFFGANPDIAKCDPSRLVQKYVSERNRLNRKPFGARLSRFFMALADSEVLCIVESFVEFMGNQASTLVDVMVRRQLKRAQNGVAQKIQLV